MKKIALVLGVTFFTVFTFGSAATASVNDVLADKLIVQDDKTQVEISELPAEVTQSLSQSEYQAWTIQEAYRVQDTEKGTYYELHVSDGQNTQKVKISESGEVMEGKSEDRGMDQGAQDEGLEGTEEPGTQDQGTEEGTY